MKLKISTTDKTFGKMCLTAIRDFFPICGLQSRERQGEAWT